MKSTANWTPLVLTIVLACGDSTPPEPPNTPPEAVGTIENWEMAVGDRLSVPNLGRFFTDADGDSLTYTAEFSGDTVVTLQVSGADLASIGPGNCRRRRASNEPQYRGNGPGSVQLRETGGRRLTRG